MAKEKKDITTGLSVKEEKFARLVANGSKLVDAYALVYNASKTRKLMTEYAYKLSKKYAVALRIEMLIEEDRERYSIKKDWIVDKLKLIAEVGTEREQVEEIKITKGRGSSTQITHTTETRRLEKLVDSAGANSAIDKLIKMAGLYAAEKVEETTKKKFVIEYKEITNNE